MDVIPGDDGDDDHDADDNDEGSSGCRYGFGAVSTRRGTVPSCFVPAALPGVKLFVFISIQCLLSVFPSEVTSLVGRPPVKRPETQQRVGHALITFHAICAARRGVCLLLGEGRLSHSWVLFYFAYRSW